MIELSFLEIIFWIGLATLLGMLWGVYVTHESSRRELITILLTSNNSDEVVKQVKDLL